METNKSNRILSHNKDDISRQNKAFSSDSKLNASLEKENNDQNVEMMIEEVSVHPAEQSSVLDHKTSNVVIDDSMIAKFVANHAVIFIALSIINFTLAVLITLFCFVFPGAYENIKSEIGKARDWTISKVELGVTYGQELPNVGLNYAQKGIEVFSSPFSWMWRFLNCIGKCFGLQMPDVSFPLISVYLPK